MKKAPAGNPQPIATAPTKLAGAGGTGVKALAQQACLGKHAALMNGTQVVGCFQSPKEANAARAGVAGLKPKLIFW